MKLLTFCFVVLLVCCSVQTVSAQATGSWVKVAPPEEQFAVLMPQFAEGKTQKHSYEQLDVDATLYSVAEEGVVYIVWSLINRNFRNAAQVDVDDYLDACAELVWESFLKARRDKSKSPKVMYYQRAVQAGGLAGREYFITLGNKPGVVRFFVNEEKIFVLTVLNADAGSSGSLRFLSSFEPDREKAKQSPDTDAATDGTAKLILQRGPGRGGNTDPAGQVADNNGGVDYDKVFTPREVTEKARITYRPEPAYTERARKYRVSGTVILEAVLSKTGEVTDVQVRNKLPHGLTRASVEAVKLIKFTPALKDGIPVSQRIMVEYNYNIY